MQLGPSFPLPPVPVPMDSVLGRGMLACVHFPLLRTSSPALHGAKSGRRRTGVGDSSLTLPKMLPSSSSSCLSNLMFRLGCVFSNLASMTEATQGSGEAVAAESGNLRVILHLILFGRFQISVHSYKPYLISNSEGDMAVSWRVLVI